MPGPVNVVFYAPSYDSLGGGEIWLNRVANELRRRAHTVTVIGKRRPGDPVVGTWEDGIDRVYLIEDAAAPAIVAQSGPLARLKAEVARSLRSGLGLRLDRLIHGWRPPGMFERDIPPDAHVRLASIIRASQIRAGDSPTVVICSDVYTASHVSAAVERGQLELDYVIVHHLSFESLSQGTSRALALAAGRAASFVALTDEDAEGFRRAGFARVSSVPNPNPPVSDPVSSPEQVVVWMGRMSPQKSVHIAVEAWSRVCRAHPDWRLVLYGDGEERPRVVSRIAELGVGGSVRLAGVTADPQAVFAHASVNLLPSQFEGWGLVIGEAGLHGVPTVAFDCAPGVRAQIEDRVNGMLVPLNDVARFASDLDAVLSDDRLRLSLGDAARTRARDFSAARVGDLWDSVLAGATARRRLTPNTVQAGPSSTPEAIVRPVTRLPVTLCISTRNASPDLRGCVASVAEWISELVVIDMESSDDTLTVARQLGAKIVQVPAAGWAEPGRQAGIEAATQPWILVLDADERAGAQMHEALERCIEDPQVDGVWLPRQNFQFGFWVEGAGIWPDWQLRFFRREKTTWPGHRTHVGAVVDGTVVRLAAEPGNAIVHHSFPSIAAWVNSTNRYTDLEAGNMDEQGVKASLPRLIGIPLLRFGDLYVRQRGYRGGRYGLSVALMSFCYWLLAELKLWERRLGGTHTPPGAIPEPDRVSDSV